jgi:hypothetical protein
VSIAAPPAEKGVTKLGQGRSADLSARWELDPYDPRRAAWRKAAWPDAERLGAAFRLALDVEACADLLAGRAVSPAQIDQKALAQAQQTTHVRLVAPADLLAIGEAA